MQQALKWLFIIWIGLIPIVIILIIISEIQMSQDKKAYEEIKDVGRVVCESRGIKEASLYKEQSGIHKIVIYEHGSVGNLNSEIIDYYYPYVWMPSSINDLELVACIEFDWKEILDIGSFHFTD